MAWDIQALFREHNRSIRRGLVRRGLPRDVAADLTQDAFVRLLSLPNGLQDGNPKGYLTAVASNLGIDLVRRRGRSPFAELSADAQADIADRAPSAESALADKQKLEAVRRALDELPNRTREAFELHRFDDLTIAEVGRRLGLSTSRAGALVREAYLHVRDRVRADLG